MGASSAEGRIHGGLRIRAGEVEDAGPIAAIRVNGWQTAYRGQLPHEMLDAMSVDRDVIRYADHIGNLAPDRRLWVAELDSMVVGFASTGPGRDPEAAGVGEIYAIYVRPDLYRRGIGHKLLDHALQDLADRGYSEAVLWTLGTNDPARHFYEREGWRPDGAAKVDHLDGFELHEVRYRRKLGEVQVEPS